MEELPVCQGECEGLNTPDCGEVGPLGFFCTRHEKHTGPHIACGGPGVHNLHLWE